MYFKVQSEEILHTYKDMQNHPPQGQSSHSSSLYLVLHNPLHPSTTPSKPNSPLYLFCCSSPPCPSYHKVVWALSLKYILNLAGLYHLHLQYSGLSHYVWLHRIITVALQLIFVFPLLHLYIPHNTAQVIFYNSNQIRLQLLWEAEAKGSQVQAFAG